MPAVLAGDAISLPNGMLEMSGVVDLPELGRELPGLLRIRPDTQITAGRLDIRKLTLRGGKTPTAQASLEIEAETERIRSALLASISHVLRTPLAVMAGASSSLAQSGERLSVADRRALAQSIFN